MRLGLRAVHVVVVAMVVVAATAAPASRAPGRAAAYEPAPEEMPPAESSGGDRVAALGTAEGAIGFVETVPPGGRAARLDARQRLGPARGHATSIERPPDA